MSSFQSALGVCHFTAEIEILNFIRFVLDVVTVQTRFPPPHGMFRLSVCFCLKGVDDTGRPLVLCFPCDTAKSVFSNDSESVRDRASTMMDLLWYKAIPPPRSSTLVDGCMYSQVVSSL